MTPRRMTDMVIEAAADWEYQAATVGYPGPVVEGSPDLEPKNLGHRVGRFHFAAHFGKPVKVIDNAAMPRRELPGWPHALPGARHRAGLGVDPR